MAYSANIHNAIFSHAWLPYTGSINHAIPNVATLSKLEEYQGGETLHVGNHRCFNISHDGHVLNPLISTSSRSIQLCDVL